MKKIVILQHGGGELTNQLWNYISIYAYGKEKGVPVVNNSFFEYGSNFCTPKSHLSNLLLYRPFKNHLKRRNSFKRQLWRKFYKIYVYVVKTFKKSSIVSSVNGNNAVTYLPPTSTDFTEPDKKTLYFDGWLFRNPVGLEKYREDILKYFRPADVVINKVDKFLQPHLGKYLVGVHIRQGDYKVFKGGKYFVEQKRIQEIISKYLSFSGRTIENTFFIFTSDGSIEKDVFSELNYTVSNMGPVEDLFLLSKMKVVLGSDSSFGDFSAWYGNIPHIVFQKEAMDWEYYKEKNIFFENKYSTMVHY
ncbi:hypothetical protein COW81_03320 [Candidatus Campbellbacteria bacterium CG22_combo_CG10-13_8_21_14_all_36_13]|uniref:Alpha-1,2-fucosyltransferase n=1 Tax=Candidatus Campbellbacteria bacterium CG22_combo_CG10-13_8_21_14_all_36_13 TaxID=1974529 RepID=A0A2H0DXH5_9BACT|nr:MAG: hypothetical protein COW81_03320 [Candidatus Campbellbacteria bacterium CG22_combo_CG10-13_8_21_14_all_36_13]